jgi:hypothetical protein
VEFSFGERLSFRPVDMFFRSTFAWWRGSSDSVVINLWFSGVSRFSVVVG